MILALLLLLAPGAAGADTSAPASTATASGVAGSIVRSKEWIVRRGKSREEEFVGDVRYDAAGTKLSSDWALYRQGPNDWQARGHVYARKEFTAGDVIETWGVKAWYDENTLKGRLEPAKGGRVPVLHSPPQSGGEPDHAEGDHLSWIGEQVGVLSGHAHGWGPRGEFWADTAHYERRPAAKGLPVPQSLELTGSRPAVHDYTGRKDFAARADRIFAEDAPRRADLTGRAIGWLLDQSTAPATATAVPGADPRCGRGDRSVGPGPDERVSALLAPRDETPAEEERRFREAESVAYAARACPWITREDFWADEAHYEQLPDRRLTLIGGRPVLQKLDDHALVADDHSMAVKADRIVAFGAARRIVATGKVRGWMVFKKDEKKSSDKNKKKSQEKK